MRILQFTPPPSFPKDDTSDYYTIKLTEPEYGEYIAQLGIELPKRGPANWALLPRNLKMLTIKIGSKPAVDVIISEKEILEYDDLMITNESVQIKIPKAISRYVIVTAGYKRLEIK